MSPFCVQTIYEMKKFLNLKTVGWVISTLLCLYTVVIFPQNMAIHSTTSIFFFINSKKINNQVQFSVCSMQICTLCINDLWQEKFPNSKSDGEVIQTKGTSTLVANAYTPTRHFHHFNNRNSYYRKTLKTDHWEYSFYHILGKHKMLAYFPSKNYKSNNFCTLLGCDVLRASSIPFFSRGDGYWGNVVLYLLQRANLHRIYEKKDV